MNLREVIRVALRALARNKMRTAFTMLGIIIGVGAVISTVAIGEGAANQVQQQIQALGENMVFIAAGSVNRGGVRMGSEATKTLTVGDANAILQRIPLITHVSPGVNSAGQVVFGNKNWFTHVNGVAPGYLQIRNWGIMRGSMFSQREVDVAANVCLIGQTVAQNLFGTGDPVGSTIRIHNLPVLVVGELIPKGQSPFGQDEDDVIMMPYTTVQKKILGVNWVNYITASADTQQDIAPAEQEITALLRQRHHLRADAESDFIIRSPNDLADAQEQAGRVMTMLLASIASVSLLVGGIGIMNIMLVSVTERTREIGIRIAVGATTSDVQRQFLSEAMVLSMLGGAVGVIVGVFGSSVVSAMLGWPTQIPPLAIAVAVIFSAGVGIFFGYYPAHKAAHLDPIEALHYE
jgi:putative ABC transport system permease protein